MRENKIIVVLMIIASFLCVGGLFLGQFKYLFILGLMISIITSAFAIFKCNEPN